MPNLAIGFPLGPNWKGGVSIPCVGASSSATKESARLSMGRTTSHGAFLGRERLQEFLHAHELAAEAHLVGVFRHARALVFGHGNADLLDQEAGVAADAVRGQVDREELARLEDRARREQR